MTDIAPAPPPPATLPELSGRMAEELTQLDRELVEVDLLIAQARTEATRHEARRAAAGEKLTTATATATSAGTTLDPIVAADLNAQLVLLTKRAALMESQVDVLEGKRRALGRYRDAMAVYAEALEGFGDVPIAARGGQAGFRQGTGPARSHEVSRRRSPASFSARRRTSAARSPGRCTTAPPRA